MKGEFEKRIEEESYEYYIPETPDKVRVVRVEQARKIIDEARKEFPGVYENISVNGQTVIFIDPEKTKQWFWKYFGDAE
jgi:hypothetical protein